MNLPVKKFRGAAFFAACFSCAILLLQVFSHPAFAAGNDENATVTAELRKDYPHIPIDAISKTDMDGIFEVISQGNIFYYHLKTGSIINGDVIRKGRSITLARKEELTARLIKDLPLSKAIKIGNGKNTVIEFSDPDCPFCRRAEAFLKTRNDITVYLFLFPLPMHHEAYKKSLKVLCSADRASAYEDAIGGKFDSPFTLPDGCEKKNSPILNEHLEWGKKLGVNGTPAFWINGTHVEGADSDRITNLLAHGPVAKAK